MAKESNVPASRREAPSAMSPFDMLHNQIDRIFNDFGSGFGTEARFRLER